MKYFIDEKNSSCLEINVRIHLSRFVDQAGSSIILCLILSLGLALRVYFFTGINGADDINYFHNIKLLFNNSFSPGGLISSRLGFIYPVYIFMALFGRTEWAATSWILLCGLGEIILIYYFGKALFNKKVGLWASFFLSIYPAHIIGSTRAMPDVPLSLLLSFSIYLVSLANFKYEAKDFHLKYFYFLAGIIWYLGFLIKFQAIILVTLYICIIIYQMVERKFKFYNWSYLAIGMIVVLFSESLYYYFHDMHPFKHFVNILTFYSEGAHHTNDPLIYPLYFFNISRGLTIVDYSPGLVFYLVLPAMVYALWRKRSKQVLWVFLWFIIIFMYLSFGTQSITSYVLTNKETRFTLFCVTPLFLILAYVFPYINRYIRYILTFFLLVSSFHYSDKAADWWNYKGGPCTCRKKDIQLIYSYLQTQPPKPIYLERDLAYDMLDIYSTYQWDLRNILEHRDLRKIEDSYIILDISGHQVFPSKEDILRHKYPAYVHDVPKSWLLLKTILDSSDKNLRSYNPKIYYAPPV